MGFASVLLVKGRFRQKLSCRLDMDFHNSITVLFVNDLLLIVHSTGHGRAVYSMQSVLAFVLICNPLFQGFYTHTWALTPAVCHNYSRHWKLCLVTLKTTPIQQLALQSPASNHSSPFSCSMKHTPWRTLLHTPYQTPRPQRGHSLARRWRAKLQQSTIFIMTREICRKGEGCCGE